MEAIEGEGEELGDVRLLSAGGQREETGHRRRLLCGIFGLHHLELRIRLNFRIGPSVRVWDVRREMQIADLQEKHQRFLVQFNGASLSLSCRDSDLDQL